MTRLNIQNPTTEAVAVSFIAVAVIYSFADISGAHFNPAVTFATVVTGVGDMTWQRGAAFMAAQLLGSVWASFWFIVTFPDGVKNLKTLALTPDPNIGYGNQIMMEFTLTFFLIYVIFSVAFDTVDNKVKVKQVIPGQSGGGQNAPQALTIYTASGDSKAGFAPLAIGFTLGMLSLVGGSVSGGAYNPARVFGAAMCSGIWDGQWVYWLGDFMGAAAAAWTQLLFKRLRKEAAKTK